MKKSNLVLTVFLTMLALMASCVPAAAASNTVNPDTDRGTIAVTLKKDGNGIGGLEVTLYRVGAGKVENSQLLFELLPELQGAEAELNGLTGTQNAEAAASLLAFIRGQESSPVKALRATTNADGTALFEDLPVGIYLVQSSGNAAYQAITPYLLQLPANNDEGTAWDFDIQGAPKVEAQPGGGVTPPVEPPEIPTPDPGEEPEEGRPVEPLPELPQTGLLQWPIPLMTAAGLLLIALGLRWKRKDDHT